MVIKIQDWYFPPGIAFIICRKSVPFTEKLPRKPETGIKVGSEEMEHEFAFGTSRPKKPDYILRFSVALGNFPLG